MSSCFGCICNSCARNVNLGTQYFTPGEVDECCFNCDDCGATNGRTRWDPENNCYSGRWMPECARYREAQKHIEMRARIARTKFKVIAGGNCK